MTDGFESRVGITPTTISIASSHSATLFQFPDHTSPLGFRNQFNAGVSLIIPAYNEAHRISPTIEKYLDVLKSIGLPFEIIVVADGTDHTVDLVQDFCSSGVKSLRVGHKLGKGGAILHGFKNAQFSVKGYADADGSLSAKDLHEMITTILNSDYDCVIASRWVPGSVWLRKEPLSKRIASRGFNVLVRALLRLPVRDTQCGAKLYRAAIVDKLLGKVTVTNLTSDVGFLFHAYKGGARIFEVPVSWDDDPRSRFHLGTMIPVMLATVLGIRVMNLPTAKYVPKQFVARFQALLGSF